MKKAKIAFAALLLAGLASCNEKTKKDYHAEHDNFKNEIDQLKIKLSATEAQLLNVSAELSELKTTFSNDSLKINK